MEGWINQTLVKCLIYPIFHIFLQYSQINQNLLCQHIYIYIYIYIYNKNTRLLLFPEFYPHDILLKIFNKFRMVPHNISNIR